MSDVATKTTRVLQDLMQQMPNGADAMTDDQLINANIADLGFDSLESLELIMLLEDEYAVALDEDQVLECKTVAALVGLIETAIKGR